MLGKPGPLVREHMNQNDYITYHSAALISLAY